MKDKIFVPLVKMVTRLKDNIDGFFFAIKTDIAIAHIRRDLRKNGWKI